MNHIGFDLVIIIDGIGKLFNYTKKGYINTDSIGEISTVEKI